MTKTLALLLDSYRELNAKRLFWISLFLSGFVVAAFAMIGISGDTVTILWFRTALQDDVFTYLDPAALYKSMFTLFAVPYWLGVVGNCLALASTAGVFPDFLAAGSIDLYLSKPISRLWLFFSKYAGALLFALLQVSIFSVCCFLVLGIRGHEWQPMIFMAIPIVTLVFSYLFSICSLIGVLTRSTVTALLVTLLIWFGLWGVQVTETVLLQKAIRTDVRAASLDRQIAETQMSLADPKAATEPTSKASFNPFGYFFSHSNRDPLQARLGQLQMERNAITTSAHFQHAIALDLLTILPKTSGTTELLDRLLSTSQEQNFEDAIVDDHDRRPGRRESFADRRAVEKAMDEDESKRTATWFIGTSLGFELVIVGFAAWVFCRRDY